MYDKKIVSKEKVDATFEGHTYQRMNCRIVYHMCLREEGGGGGGGGAIHCNVCIYEVSWLKMQATHQDDLSYVATLFLSRLQENVFYQRKWWRPFENVWERTKCYSTGEPRHKVF